MNIFSTYGNLDHHEYLASNGKVYQYTIQDDDQLTVQTDNFKITANFLQYLLNEHEWRRDHQILITKVINWLYNENQSSIYNVRFKLYDGVSSVIITTRYYFPMISETIDVFLSQDITRT